MPQSDSNTPESSPLPPSQTVTLDTPEPLIATSLVRGFAACETPLYDPRDVPTNWRRSVRWVPWSRVGRSAYGRLRRTQRALVRPTGAISHGASPSIWRSFDRAAEIAQRLGIGPKEGGLAYILPPINDTAPASALFFSLPSFTIALGPVAAALGADAPTPLGPFAAAALASGYQPGAQALPPGWQPAEVTTTAQPSAPGWQPAELTISSSTPASWRDALAQLDGTLAYLQEFKTWCRLRVPDATAPTVRKAGRRP
jgi:hypothetical protein